MNNDWYGRQFGERNHFAVSISLAGDPHPTGDAAIDAGWGCIAIWVRGRCLTRNVASDGAVSDAVQWSLTGILGWLVDVGVRLVNEEPFPDAVSFDHTRDACDWFNAAETPLLSLTEAEERDWFARRSDWGGHHRLRRAATDAALPNVVVRRLGDFLEVSWDNATWAASRGDMAFVEQRGSELVSAARAAGELRAALVDVTRAIADKHALPALAELARAASSAAAGDDDWRWLVHPQTARAIIDGVASLRARLIEHTRAQRAGFYVPHSPETLLLRNARLVSPDEVLSLLQVADTVPKAPMKALVRNLVGPTHASTLTPWQEGYEKAHEVREALGWGDEPVPDLRAWMKANHLGRATRSLSSAIDLTAMRTDDHRAAIVLNPAAQSRLHREIAEATGLGHILLDAIPVAVDGTWEHWPTAARARAFGVMLLLPEDGVRAALTPGRAPTAEDVKRVMERFGTGPHATTFHLKNLGFIASDERRSEILQQLAA